MTNLLLSLHLNQSDEHFFRSLSLNLQISHIIVLFKSINFVHHIFSIYGMLLVFDTSELWLCLVSWAFTWIELLLLFIYLLMDDVDTIDHLWLVILFQWKESHIFVDDKCLCVVRIEFFLLKNIYGFGHPMRFH